MFDNLAQELGAQKPKTFVEEAWHKEQERKKYDIIRVKNPTAQDFYQKYDINQFQKVPANSTIDIPRYIAVRYVQHMMEQIVHQTQKEMHDKDIAERRLKGFADYKDKYTENDETYMTDSYPKTNDPKVIEKIYNDLWVGLVYEFGRDIPPQTVDPRSGEVDLTPVSQRVLEGLDKRRVDPSDSPISAFQAIPQPLPPQPSPAATIPPQPTGFSAMNQRLTVDEVTND